MTKEDDINNIIASHNNELLLNILWGDPGIVAKIRSHLNNISGENIKYYRDHFCENSHIE